MTSPTFDTVRTAATVFRQALVRMDRDEFVSLANFPVGACGDAAPLLGHYLLDQGFGTWTYVNGERPQGNHGFESHAWIEQEGLIVDITADQFADISDAVIVTTDQSWHSQFRVADATHPARIDIYDDYTRATLRRMYDRALEAL